MPYLGYEAMSDTYSSHSSAPDQPPFETVVGMMSAPMDKLKDMDMFAKFPSSDERAHATEEAARHL